MLAFAIASGRPFLGRYEVQQGPVIMFSPEGNRQEFHDRVRQIDERMDLDPNELPLKFIEDIPQLYLDDRDHQEYLMAAIKEIHPALVIFDPLEKSLRGGFLRDEEVKPATDFMNLVRSKFGCSFMVAHHTNRGDAKTDHGRIKGAGLLYSFGDCYIYLRETNGQVQVTSDHKNFDKAEPFNAAMTKVDGNACYEIVDGDAPGTEKKMELDERILQYLAENFSKATPLYKLRKELGGDTTKYPPALNRLKAEKEIKALTKGWKITAKGKKRALDSGLVEPNHFEPKNKKKAQKTVKKTKKETGKNNLEPIKK